MMTQSTVEIPICSLGELPEGLGRAFEVCGLALAVFRTRDNGVHAIDNVCPHRGGPMADGMLAGHQIVCPYHAFKFELSTGQCDQPSTCPLNVYSARVENGTVFVRVPLEKGER